MGLGFLGTTEARCLSHFWEHTLSLLGASLGAPSVGEDGVPEGKGGGGGHVGWRLSSGMAVSVWASPVGRAGMFCTASPITHAWNVGLCPRGTGGYFPATRNLSRNSQGGVGLHLPGLALAPQLTWLVGGPGAVSGVWTRPLHSLSGPGSPCCSLGLWLSRVSAW